MNEKYKVKVESPLLIPGLSISAKVSESSIKKVADSLIKKVYEINNEKPEIQKRLELVIEAQKQQLKKKESEINKLKNELHEALKIPGKLSQDHEEAMTLNQLNEEGLDDKNEREE